MESCSGTNTVGDCSGGLKHQRAAHAVTCCADLLFPVNRRLSVEPGDECFAVCCPGLGSQGVMEAHERLARLGIVEVSVIGSRWGLLCTIKRIDYQHGITGFRKALGHLSERRTQSKDVGPDEHARMLACCGMHEVGIRGAIGCLDFDLRVLCLDSGGGGWQRGYQARSQCQSAEFSPGQAARAAVVLDDILD